MSVDIIARLKLAGEEFTREFNAKMGAVEKEAKASSNRISNAFKGIGGTLMAAGAVTAIAAAGRAAMEYADNLDAVAQQSNINVERFQTLKEAFRSLEVDGGQFDKAMKRLVDTMGAVQNGVVDEATPALERMGIKQKILSGEIRETDELLDAIAASTDRYATRAQFTADVVDIFGRRVGVDMANALADGGKALHAAEQAFRETGRVIDEEMIAKLAEANEKIDSFSTQASNQFAIWAANAITAMEDVGNWADQIGLKLAQLSPFGKPESFQQSIDAYERANAPRLRDSQREEVEAARAELKASLDAQRAGRRPGRREDMHLGTDGHIAGLAAKLERETAELNRLNALIRPKVDEPGDPDEPIVLPPTRTGGGGRRTAKAGKSEAEREAEAARKEAERLAEELERQTAELETQIRLGDMRAGGLEQQADVEEAIAEVRQRYSEIVGKSIPELQKQFGISEETARVLHDQLATAERLTVETVRQSQAADAAKADREAQEERDRLWRETQERWIEEQRAIQEDNFLTLADFYQDAMRSGGKSIWEDFKDEGERIIAEIAALWTLALLSGQKATLPDILGQLSAPNGVGGLAPGAGLIGTAIDLFSRRGGGAADAATAAAWSNWNVGSAASGAASGAATGGIGGLLTTAAPYLAAASFVLPMVGDLFGGLFKSAKHGRATLGFSGGSLGVGSTGGNSGEREGAASGAMGAVIDGLNRIAEVLGGDVTGAGSVSIGMYKDKWRVSTTGWSESELDFKGNSARGLKDFGADQEAAIRFAIAEALRDGVIGGISDAAKRILQSGQDLEAAIEKALLIEEIPKLLRQRTDPLGFALDQLNEKWAKTVAALKEGGATAEQFADAQRLYKLELEETKASVGEASANLKAFLDGLAFGASSPYSLRDQEAKAEAALQPFLDKINAGESIDQAKYLEAAQGFLDIERKLYGSTGQFFESMDLIQSATGRAIATIDNAAPIRTAADPFAEATATNTRTTNELLDQQGRLLVEIRDGLRFNGIGLGGTFIGDARGGFASQRLTI